MHILTKFWWWFTTQFLRLRFMKIGLMSYIARPMFIYGGNKICIGNKVRVFPGARMESHHNGKIVICDDTSIGQNFHVTAASQPLIIGKHTTILGNVFITNIDHQYTEIDKHILDQPFIIRETKIGDNCFIGYGSAIQAGTILGKQCVVGANSVVRGVFPDYCVIVGAPAKIVKKYNTSTQTWEKPNN